MSVGMSDKELLSSSKTNKVTYHLLRKLKVAKTR